MEANDEVLWKSVFSDYKCQLAAIEGGMRLALGKNFKDPRETKGFNGEFVSQKKDSQLEIPKNMWTIPYLLYASYDVKRSYFQKRGQCYN
jgi:hypothetical protein